MRSSRTIHGMMANLAWVSILASASLADSVIYVDAHATGPVVDGSSWCSAYRQLYEALAVATDGTTIRVADGIYKPDTTGLADPRRAYMLFPGGITLEGGYAGCGATDPDQRDLELFRPILTCDLANDDLPGFQHRDENCVGVLRTFWDGPNSTFDGLLIKGATNVAIWHRARDSFRRCIFVENEGDDSSGALNFDSGASTIDDCIFRRNRGKQGGAISIRGGSLDISNCRFEENQSDREFDLGQGGAIYAFDSEIALSSCFFTRNTATPGHSGFGDGGAVYQEGGSLRISACSFTMNAAKRFGGAIHFLRSFATTDDAVLRCEDTVFEDNEASFGGAIGFFAGSDSYTPSLIRNCFFRKNRAHMYGGAIGFSTGFGRVSLEVSNCTIVENVSDVGFAAGVFGEQARDLSLKNSIIWGNVGLDGKATGAAQVGNAGPGVEFNCISNWYDDVLRHNIAADPEFVPGPAGCYYLNQRTAGGAIDSPCINRGDVWSLGPWPADRTTHVGEARDVGVLDLGYHYPVTGRTFLRGDFDRDRLVNFKDIAEFQNCFSGGDPTPVSPCCRVFDWDGAMIVDLDDWSAMTDSLSFSEE